MKVIWSQESILTTVKRDNLGHRFAYLALEVGTFRWLYAKDVGWVQLSQRDGDHKLSPYRHMQILHHGQYGRKTILNWVETWLTDFWNTTCWPIWTNDPRGPMVTCQVQPGDTWQLLEFRLCVQSNTQRPHCKDYHWLGQVIENKIPEMVTHLENRQWWWFINSELQTYCQERGITSLMSVAYNLELNGCTERWNRTHIEGARTMLRDSDLSKTSGERHS